MNNLPQYESSSLGLHWIAVPSSILFHIGLAWLVVQTPERVEQNEPVWMEMTVVEPPPEPEPIVEPEPIEEPAPEPKPKPKPKPKEIDFEDIPPEPIETEPPPPTKKKVQS